jgi:hypothetical protein
MRFESRTRRIAAAGVSLLFVLSTLAVLVSASGIVSGASAQNGGANPSAEARKSELKELTVSPKELSFGERPPFEASAPKTVTIHNPNSIAVDVGFVGSSNPEFVPSFKCAGILAAHSDCVESVTFTPSSDGKKTAKLMIVNSASPKALSIKMTGKGKGAPVATATATPTATPTPVAATCPSASPGACPSSGAPSISSMIPSSAVAGDSEGVALAVCGCNLTASTVVQWNAVGQMTTFLSSNQINASIPAAEVANVGVDQVTVSADAAVSPSETFFVGSSGGPGYAVLEIDQQTNDLAYDAVNQAIYLSAPHSAPTNGDTISVFNLAEGSISSAQPAGSNPDVLAVSDDGQFLYAGIDGASTVQRFKLPNMLTDISYPLGGDSFLGPYHALDLQVAPGAPHTTAVTLGIANGSPRAEGGLVIFDDSTPRPTIAPGWLSSGNLYDSLQWGSDATTLYAANDETTSRDFYVLAVNPDGVMLENDYLDTFARGFERIHFDSGSKLIYSDEGSAIDPSTGKAIGEYAVGNGVVVPDSTLNTLFFVSLSSNIGTTTIQAFDLTKFNLIGSLTFPTVTATPIRLIRWGTNGLAFNTDQGPVYLVGGNFIH